MSKSITTITWWIDNKLNVNNSPLAEHKEALDAHEIEIISEMRRDGMSKGELFVTLNTAVNGLPTYYKGYWEHSNL